MPEGLKRWGLATLGLCAVVAVLWLSYPRMLTMAPGRLHVWLLDVGQGEALFIEFPGDKTLLLDGGGYYRDALDVGTRVVGSFLWDRGYGSLDYLGATHSDQDHIDGVESVLEHFTVRHFLDRADGLRDPRFSRLRRRALVRGVTPLLLQSGDELRVGEVKLRLLHPSPGFKDTGTGEPVPARLRNDRSWVIRLEYGAFSMLLTGDITETAERWLVRQGAPLGAAVLKSPHHGSRLSSSPEFLRAVGARDVLVSSGYANVFNHPHPEALARYLKRGMRVWRTDRMGALELVTDGQSYRIQTHADLSVWD